MFDPFDCAKISIRKGIAKQTRNWKEDFAFVSLCRRWEASVMESHNRLKVDKIAKQPKIVFKSSFCGNFVCLIATDFIFV